MFNGAGHLTITGGTFSLSSDEVFKEDTYTGGLFAFTSKADAKLTITGGTFKATKAKLGDTIYILGTVNELEIGGNAVIEGGVYVDSAEKITISGTPTIQKVSGGSAYSLKLASGKVVDATGLTTGASIGVNADGVFTTAFADAAAAEAAKGFFTCEVSDKEISLAGTTLKVAEPAGDAPVDPDAPTAHCEYCDQDVVWTEWDGAAVTGDAHLVIPANGTALSSHVTFTNGHVVIDLQGHALTSDKQVFRVGAGANMYIIDSVGGGTVTGKGTTAHGGIAMFSGAGNLTITGGTFALAEDEAFNEAKYNGGLFAFTSSANGKLTITGGTFKATEAGKGDTIYILGTVNELEIGGNAVIEGGVYVDSAEKFTISGTPTIQKVSGGSAYSLKLTTGKVVDITGLTAGASIGITASDVFTTEFATEAAANAAKAYLTCEVADKEISLEGKALKVADPATEPAPEETTAPVVPEETTPEETTAPTQPAGEECEHCGQVVEWKTWDGLTFTEGGHYIVPENLAQLTTHAIVKEMEVVLDLNGQTVESTVKVFHVTDGGELTIVDSSAAKTGTVIGKGKGSGTHAGVIQVYESNAAAKLTILGGTYKMKEGSQAKNGGIIHTNKNCEVVVKNATIEGGTAALGAAIYVNGNVKLTVGEGAVIKAGKASTYGDTIYVTDATPRIVIEDNAWIEGGIYATSTAAGVITVQGAPVIQKVEGGSAYSFKGSALNVGQLQEGASIGITKAEDGAFTTEFADQAAAEAAMAFFTADEETKQIKVEDRVLVIAEKTEAPAEPAVAPGDMNGDGMITDADALHLLRYVLFPDLYPINQDGDMNGDGMVTDADALHLLRYVLFPDLYPLYPNK